jgi:CIC family chloride channel protein
LAHPAELIAYAVLGVVGGLISLAFSKGLLELRQRFLNLSPSTAIFQPAIGGLMVGVILVFFPQVISVGYEYVDQALNGGMLLRTMLLLCAVKLVATVISYSSGNAGGIFAPSLYLGAMAGGAVGMIVHQVAPFPTAAPGAYALVGMGTLFAGIIRAPMTSVIMIFELTQDYQILVPLMIANMLSFMISRRFQPKPVYHALLEQNDIHLPDADTRLGKRAWRAKHVMTRDITFVSTDTVVEEVAKTFEETPSTFLLVGDRNHLTGIVTRKAVDAAMQSGRGMDQIKALSSGDFVYLHEDQPLDIALERFGSNPSVVPVLSRNDNRKVEGVITLDTILKFIQMKSA